MNEENKDDQLAHLAEQAAAQALSSMPDYLRHHSIERSRAISRAFVIPGTPAACFANAIKDDASFGYLRGGWMEYGGGGGHVIGEQGLPTALLLALMEAKDFTQLLIDARRLAASRSSSIAFYSPIVGVTIDRTKMLSGNVEITTWEQVSESRQKSIFAGGPNASLTSGDEFPQMRPEAKCAIKIHSDSTQILFPAFPQKDYASTSADAIKRFEIVSDVLRCISALVFSPVATIGSWFELNEPFARRLTGITYQWTRDIFEVRFMQKPAELNSGSLFTLFEQFQKLRKSEQEVLRIGLDRLNLSLKEPSIVDRAIDQGIALEAILLYGINEQDRGELRYRQAVRGAAFLGGNHEEKLKTYHLLRDAYDIRSKAVHSGRVGKDSEMASVLETLNSASIICAKIARKLIERGSFPGWEDEYVLRSEGMTEFER